MTDIINGEAMSKQQSTAHDPSTEKSNAESTTTLEPPAPLEKSSILAFPSHRVRPPVPDPLQMLLELPETSSPADDPGNELNSDPACIIGCAIVWVRNSETTKSSQPGFPLQILTRLIHHADNDCLASEMVLAWLVAKGHISQDDLDDVLVAKFGGEVQS